MIIRLYNRVSQQRSIPAGIPMVLALALFVGACSSPLNNDERADGDEGGPTVTATVPVMTVVTPTAVDPSSIPADGSGTPESIDVPDVYIVEEGDTLYNIAARFRVEIAALVEANDLADPNDIYEGQELTIPRP